MPGHRSLRLVEVELLGAEHPHDAVKDAELQRRECPDHDASRAKALRAELDNTGLLSDVHHALGDRAVPAGSGLVHLRQERVGRVRDDGRGDARDDAGAQAHGGVEHAAALGGALPEVPVHGLGDAALHRELRHGVGDLLEEDRAEARVEAAEHALLLHEPRGHARERGGEAGVGDAADAAGLQGAQEAVRDKLGASGRPEVDGHAVVPRLLVSNGLHGLDLEELDAAKLEPALDEVANARGRQARGERHGALLLDHLAEAADQALVVLRGLQLDARLHDVDGADRAVGERAADAAREGRLGVVHHVVGLLSGRHGPSESVRWRRDECKARG
mmetsp:Transcript_19423/g.52854  ORF Transcript_19423/g.52854 Transcript_19423/m.52854 type:complete len:332 (+) Transcript_19423:175-1170(+)